MLCIYVNSHLVVIACVVCLACLYIIPLHMDRVVVERSFLPQ